MALKQKINRVLASTTGYQLRKPAQGRLEVFLETLHRYGFRPQAIYDIGAHHGDWTRGALQFFPEAAYTLIEPQEDLKSFASDLIGKPQIRWVTAGAGAKSGKSSFYVGSRADSASLVPMTESAGVREVVIEIKTLDELAAAAGQIPNLVKIDAEGYDLQVLDGATTLIGVTDIFLLEAVFRDYENSPMEVINKMHRLGYDLLDITGLNHSPKWGILWAMELAFVRRGCALFADAVSYA